MRNINQVRKSNGRFGGISHFLRNLAIIVFVFISGFYGYEAFSRFKGETYKEVKKVSSSVASAVIPVVKAERAPDRLDKAIEVMKREVVMSIRDKESRGFTPKSGEVFYTHDSPKSLRAECQRTGGERNLECESWGIMQMKIPTILLWNTKLGRAPMSEKEALLLALDNEKAVQFAQDVIFGVAGSCYSWTTCGSAEKEKIEMIRKLETI